MSSTVAPQDQYFYTHRLDNGLQMIGQRMPDVQSAATVFWVNTGTRDEPAKEMGVSHFLEHMAFKRTEHYTSEQIDRAFEEMGADHNAATSREMTFYWARALSENVPWALDVLTELTHPLLDETDFNQERKVILEEIARGEDQPAQVLFNSFLRDYFGSHPLGLDTLGTPETIKALTVQEMRAYWRRRYGAENVIFAIAGNFEWPEVVEKLETLTRNWERGETGRPLTPAPFRPHLYVYPRDQFAQEQVAVGVPSVSRNDPRYYASAVLATILGDERGSRLFWALYQTGLAETVSAEGLEFEDNGLLMVYFATEPGQAAAALKAARSEMQRLQDLDISEDELARAKTKLNASVVIGGESTNERVMGLINSWLTQGRLETLEEIRQKIDGVSMDDLGALVRDFPVYPDQMITAVGPVPESELRAGV